MMIYKQIDRQAGFTLLEIVIALAIMAIMLTIGYGAIENISRSKRMLDELRDVRLIADSVLLRLSRELQLAYPHPTRSIMPPCDPTSQPVTTQTPLLGARTNLSNGRQGDSITFLALEGGQYLPDGGQHTGIVQITYKLVENAHSTESPPRFTLYREELPLLPDPKTACERAIVFPISDRVTSLSFTYYDKEKDQWSSSWGPPNQTEIPTAIQFSLGIALISGGERTVASAVPLRSP